MAFRRVSSRRQAGTHSRPERREQEEEEIVENPNAYGLFGHHYEVPDVGPFPEHEHEHDGQGMHGHGHQHYPYATQHDEWQPVQLQQVPSHGQQRPSQQQQQQQQQFQHSSGYHQQIVQPGQSTDYLGPAGSEGHVPLVGLNYTHPSQSQQKLGLNPSVEADIGGKDEGHGRGNSAFEMVHSAKSGTHLQEYGSEVPIHWRHLLKRPVIRQWVLQDKLYREIEERAISQYELFFDLIFVGVIHHLADGAAEAATGLNVGKFILVFFPAWSIWTDVRSYINVSGTDDICQRLYILINMLLLVGYAANATGIIIDKESASAHAAAAASSVASGGHGTSPGAPDTGASHIQVRAIQAAVGAAGSYLVKRSGSSASSGPAPILVQEIGHTGYWFASGWHAAMASAISFYLVAKFCRLFLYFLYGLLLPKFRKALWLGMAMLTIISAVYLPIIFITQPGWIVILIVVGISMELSSRFIMAGIMQKLHGMAKHRGHKTYLPAYSLPHLMERMTQFTILVVGESIMNATYVAFSGEFGPQRMYWRACLSVVIPFLIIWLYFDNDSSRTFVHGLKRHWFTSITFTHLHFPLCASLILMSSAMVKLIQEEAVEQGYLWFFSGSIATAMLCIGLLGTLHKSLDVWGSSLIPKSARIAARFILAAIFAVMPMLYHWRSVEFLGVHAGMLVLVVVFETVGKLGSYGRRYDPVRAEELRNRRKAVGRKGVDPDDSIPLSDLPSDSPPREKPGHARRISSTANVLLNAATHKLNKDAKVKGPGRRASWHEYDDLTPVERGEEDVGEEDVGKLETKEMSSGDRWAYVAI